MQLLKNKSKQICAISKVYKTFIWNSYILKLLNYLIQLIENYLTKFLLFPSYFFFFLREEIILSGMK